MSKCIACLEPMGALKAIQKIVDRQADDPKLWRLYDVVHVEGGPPIRKPITRFESELQKALRELHVEIENWSQS